jgi:hypothetical protein
MKHHTVLWRWWQGTICRFPLCAHYHQGPLHTTTPSAMVQHTPPGQIVLNQLYATVVQTFALCAVLQLADTAFVPRMCTLQT